MTRRPPGATRWKKAGLTTSTSSSCRASWSVAGAEKLRKVAQRVKATYDGGNQVVVPALKIRSIEIR